MIKQSESQIQSAILDYLAMLESRGKLYYFRSASGAMKLESGRYFRTGRAGCPDISVIIKGGQYIGVEIKTPTGKLSPEQKQVAKQLESLGGISLTVRSLNELIEDFRTLKII